MQGSAPMQTQHDGEFAAHTTHCTKEILSNVHSDDSTSITSQSIKLTAPLIDLHVQSVLTTSAVSVRA